MSTTRLSRFVRNRVVAVSLPVLALLLIALGRFAEPAADAELRVLKMGLGSGTVTSTPAGITCGTDCSEIYAPSVSVSLTAMPDAGSTFLGWDVDPDGDPATTPDCSGTSTTCSVPSLTAARSVRPTFGLAIAAIADFRPDGPAASDGIRGYLNANPAVNSAARFVAALPVEYHQNWLLMSRSESLQPGSADFPRILLPSPDARFVFTIGMATHSSYPGAHPNAIEYMQWDPGQRNFRFHEIVVDAIGAMGSIPARARGISIDDEKCSKCHSTRNVLSLNRSVTPPVPGAVGTDGIPPGTVKAKNKPNWDSYDSWGGLMPFNRDRIYQGSVEAAAFRKFLNPWSWSANDAARAIIGQLRLQPPGVTPTHAIRRMRGGASDGHITFAFDAAPPVLSEPAPTSPGTGIEAPVSTAYSFDGATPSGTPSTVTRGGAHVLLHHTSDLLGTGVGVEGRAVQLFDLLGGLDGSLNQLRIADEVITHRWATGSFPIDVRPIALAITRGCFTIDAATNTVTSTPALTIDLGFFDTRNGMRINELLTDTRNRAQSLPRRKADIQKRNLDRTGDPYSVSALNGLIQQYGAATSFGVDVSMTRLRQEVFRRPNDLGFPDVTVMGGIYVDREVHGVNNPRLALYRYFLEPLGVSVDKWSMSVRGRSRTYTFADVFGTYTNTFIGELEDSLASNPAGGLSGPPPYDCADLIPAVNNTLATLPDVNDVPKYTDVQRVFNKSCIECHGGLDYPPYSNYGSFLDLSENETPPAGEDRLDRSHDLVTSAYISADTTTSFLYQRISALSENCPFGLMPCGGPKLSRVDIETIARWILGGAPNTRGDPHIETVDGVNYDFQSAGEFVLLRGQNLEIQARHTAVTTAAPLGPNPYTGLASCVSVNSAAALRVGRHRISYQPNISGHPDPEGLQLRVDGKLVRLSAQGLPLDSGGRLVQTTAPGGIQVEAPGGTVVVITPGWWDHYQLWYLNIDARHARATEGVMGAVAAGNWLPALPDGSLLGPPSDLHQRYVDLYQRFENAWRVSDATTLFDYGPGTSTSTFTIEQWPVENPQDCTVPPQPSGPPPRPPLPPLPVAVAERHCQAIAAANHKSNCVLDVMATGDSGFARTYLRSQEVERNGIPPAPGLVSPENFRTDLTARVDFTWNKTTDANGDTVTYRHCVWEVRSRYTFNACEAVDSPAPPWLRGALWSLLMALLFCVLLAVLFFMGVRRRPVLLSFVAVAIVAVVVTFLVGRGAPRSLSRTVAGLEPGKAYYWKVIAEDGKAGTVESETRRFEIR